MQFARQLDAKVIGPFQAYETVVFFLPHMLIVGTRGIWKRIVRKND